MSIILYLM